MPTYDFRCKGCTAEFTEIMSIAQHGKKKPACPECGGKQVTQLVTGFQVVTSRKS